MFFPLPPLLLPISPSSRAISSSLLTSDAAAAALTFPKPQPLPAIEGAAGYSQSPPPFPLSRSLVSYKQTIHCPQTQNLALPLRRNRHRYRRRFDRVFFCLCVCRIGEGKETMNFRNVKVPNVPGAGAAGTLVKVALIGGTVVYAGLNSLYNVEGGHRAIVFNRIQGIKDKPWSSGLAWLRLTPVVMATHDVHGYLPPVAAAAPGGHG
ncbi:hypothetical protein ZIOFF_001859 [Zingiber officinale]|uniref:Prohibitin n=1 Tax=Zingiber officinale TaxID=94328 RepID=A0A8J5M844_ZINOF|nr:hypothetical protein ZIOFF_001859 [Zingiber officinale]